MAQAELEVVASEFYQSLFTAQVDTHPEKITAFVEPEVSEAMNEKLCAPITDTEVKRALFMMHPNKLSGPDVKAQLLPRWFW